MAPADWISLIFILTLSLPVKGHEACFGELPWKYDSHSHSCFSRFFTPTNWTEARDYCRQVQLGNNFGVTTHLAKIDDDITNDFVAGMTIYSARSWIGLHHMQDKGEHRWDGYPDETPKYINPNWYKKVYPYVAISSKGRWIGYTGVERMGTVCQQRAKTIGTVTCEQDFLTDGFKIICTSEKCPVKASCEWTYKYDVDKDFLPWRPINDYNHAFQIHDATGGNISYITTCSTNLTEDNTNMTIGTLMFKMKMYPNITVEGVSTNQKAQTIGRLNIHICKPRKVTESSTRPSTDPIVESSTCTCPIVEFSTCTCPIVESSTILSTGAKVGVILASNVIVIVLTIGLMLAFRKLREKRNKSHSSHESRTERVNVSFHQEEPEMSESGYDYVTGNTRPPGINFQTPSQNMSRNISYEGEELQDIEDTVYEDPTGGDNGRDKREYDILHPDDPNYSNLNRDPPKQYMTIA